MLHDVNSVAGASDLTLLCFLRGRWKLTGCCPLMQMKGGAIETHNRPCSSAFRITTEIKAEVPPDERSLEH